MKKLLILLCLSTPVFSQTIQGTAPDGNYYVPQVSGGTGTNTVIPQSQLSPPISGSGACTIVNNTYTNYAYIDPITNIIYIQHVSMNGAVTDNFAAQLYASGTTGEGSYRVLVGK